MREIKLEELKKLQLDILCSVHDFCVKNNIMYFLSSGTLIGAIRHKGYIPWDDDIDIAMPRKDYDRFFQSYNAEKFLAMNFDKDSDWPYIMGKVYDTRTILKEGFFTYRDLGVFIDIFPIDGLPNKNLARKIYLQKISIIRYLILQKKFPPKNSTNWVKSLYHRLFRIALFPFHIKNLLYWQNKLICKYELDTSLCVASLATTSERIPCDKSCFFSIVEKEFEGHLFHVPCGYDMWLRLIYGDYMKYPPISERFSHHKIVAHWK